MAVLDRGVIHLISLELFITKIIKLNQAENNLLLGNNVL